MIIGQLFYWLLFRGAPLDNKHANEIVDAVMRAFSPASAGEQVRA
jgi:hypothetical protein